MDNQDEKKISDENRLASENLDSGLRYHPIRRGFFSTQFNRQQIPRSDKMIIGEPTLVSISYPNEYGGADVLPMGSVK